jgi:hypothetical protein
MGSQHSEPDNHNEPEVELDDDALELAAGGFSDSGTQANSTMIVYASTFIPFDSSF